ncbi:hypothetical protein [Aquimarina latercula]|uniref:hypothetical protein n=1 Tax=Aquimarina latercula TaxID=987 RepID=UPI0004019174|nr:hypothetical protein [Aquimarina latercula]
MSTYQEKIIANIIDQLDGLAKIEAFDLLQKIEGLLLDHPSPVNATIFKKTARIEFIIKNAVSIGDREYCYLDDSCQFLLIYNYSNTEIQSKEQLYFSRPSTHEVHILDKNSLLECFKGSIIENIIYEFTQTHLVLDRNPKTGRLLLLELLDKVDP